MSGLGPLVQENLCQCFLVIDVHHNTSRAPLMWSRSRISLTDVTTMGFCHRKSMYPPYLWLRTCLPPGSASSRGKRSWRPAST